MDSRLDGTRPVSSPASVPDHDLGPGLDVLATSAAGPRAVRGGAVRVGSYFLAALLGAAAAALLLRHLGTIGVGRYVLALSIAAIVGGVSDLGLNAVGTREAATLDRDQRSALLGDLLGLRLTLTLLGLAIAAPLALAGYSSTIAIGVLLAGAGLLSQTVQDNLSTLLVVQLRLSTIAALELLRQALMVLGILLLVLAGAHLLAFLALALPVGLGSLAIVARIVRTQRSLRPTFNWQRWRALLVRVLPYSAAVAAAALYFRLAMVMVGLLSGEHQQGIFGASYRIIDVLTGVPALLASAAFPIFARAAAEDHERFAYGIGRVFEVSLIVGAGAALTIGIGAPFIMNLLGGAEYAPAAPILTIQGVGLGASFAGLVWANGLLSLGLYRQILVLNLAALLGIVIMLALLVPAYGARGAAIATAVGEIGNALANGAVLIRRHPALLRSLRAVPRVGGAAAVAVAAIALPGLSAFEHAAVAGSVYLTALLVLRAYPAELLALFPKRLAHLPRPAR